MVGNLLTAFYKINFSEFVKICPQGEEVKTFVMIAMISSVGVGSEARLSSLFCGPLLCICLLGSLLFGNLSSTVNAYLQHNFSYLLGSFLTAIAIASSAASLVAAALAWRIYF